MNFLFPDPGSGRVCVACLYSPHTILLVTADKKLTPASPGLSAHSDSPGAGHEYLNITHPGTCHLVILPRIVNSKLGLNPQL